MVDKKEKLLQLTKDFRTEFNNWWVGDGIDPVTAELWLSELGKIMSAARKEANRLKEQRQWHS